MEAGRLYQSLRGRLYRRLPVLAVPLGLLDWRQGEAAGTDGAYFYAPPDWLAAADAEDVLLHSVLHAMLGHLWTRGRRDAARWDLACDMAAEFLRQRLLDRPLEGLYAQAFYACGDGAAYSARSVYTRRIAALEAYAAPDAACSACYGSLIYALNWLESKSGRLNLPDKICIGQGYRGKTGMLGVGNCTCEFTHSVGGCPPTAGAICEFLSAQMK